MTDLTQHWRLQFDNKYLGAWNLWLAKEQRFTTVTVTIDRITQETVTMQGGKKERATLVYFKGKRTPLILTKKMGKAIQSCTGSPMPKDWIGKSITLYVERGFKTKDGPADVLRVRNAGAGDDLKRQLRGEPEPTPEEPEAPEQFGDDGAGDDPDRGP